MAENWSFPLDTPVWQILPLQSHYERPELAPSLLGKLWIYAITCFQIQKHNRRHCVWGKNTSTNQRAKLWILLIYLTVNFCYSDKIDTWYHQTIVLNINKNWYHNISNNKQLLIYVSMREGGEVGAYSTYCIHMNYSTTLHSTFSTHKLSKRHTHRTYVGQSHEIITDTSKSINHQSSIINHQSSHPHSPHTKSTTSTIPMDVHACIE